MKAAIHPHTTIATIRCSSCGTIFATRSVRPSLEVEICSECHPAYTGVEPAVQRGSRIERVERRRAAARSR